MNSIYGHKYTFSPLSGVLCDGKNLDPVDAVTLLNLLTHEAETLRSLDSGPGLDLATINCERVTSRPYTAAPCGKCRVCRLIAEVRALRAEVNELQSVGRDLLDACESTRVTHGHGDFGDVLSYREELRQRARAALHKEQP